MQRLSKFCKNTIGILMHPAECHNFLSKVFNGAADEINGIVDYQESVMHICACFYLYSWILCVMTT